MENISNILTIREVATILRCSKAHVANVMSGKVAGIERLTHLSGRPAKAGPPRLA